jgi:hypothetical protein
MIRIEEVYKKLTPAKKIDLLSVKNHSTNDIIKQVLEQHKSNVNEAKKIAHLFDAGNAFATCQKIWDFLKYQVPYSVEPSSKQTTKTLSRILYDAMNNGKNDCKHYSGFTGAILEALGYKFKYRFAGYSDYINTPTHVYCVCIEDKNEIVIDAVLNGFDVEKPYKFKIDKKMSLYKLSGLNEEAQEIAGLRSFVNKAGGKIKEAAQKIKNTGLTLSLAAPRNAFLVLLRFNVHGWASGLSKMNFDSLKWWVDWFGGNRTDLMKAIEAGAKKKRILGFDDSEIIGSDAIGEPVTVASALAAATPIIVKVSEVLKKAENLAKKAEGIQTAVNNTTSSIDKAKDTFKNLTNGKDLSDIIFKKDAGVTGDKTNLTAGDFKAPTEAESQAVAKAFINPNAPAPQAKKPINTNYLLLIGGVLGFYLLTNKK